MGEFEGYEPEEDARLKEFSTLSDAMDEAEDKIEEGVDTSAAQLDRYLSTRADYYRWRAHNKHPDHPPEERENSGEWYLRYQRILYGSYQVEKANFALETALIDKKHADKRDKVLQEDPHFEGRASYEIQNATARKVAANWLRTAANCLEMPTTRPTPSEPGSDQQ